MPRRRAGSSRSPAAQDRDAVALAVWDFAVRKDADQSAEFVRYAHQRRLRVLELPTRSEDDLPWHRAVFVMMPFGRKTYGTATIDFDAVYDEVFAPAIQLAGTSDGMPLFPTRADRGDYAANIDDVMYRRLELSRLTLADITGANANVMMEIGVRAKCRASGNVFVTQQSGPPPFDLGHIRVIPYDATDAVKARAAIARLLNGTLRAGVVDSPVCAAAGARAALAASATGRAGAGDAVIATLMREAEDALRNLDEAVALNRYESVLQRVEDTEVRVRAAALCGRLEFFDRALAHANAAIANGPSCAAAYRERGNALGRKGGDSIPSLRKATQLNPGDYDALAALGGALRRAGDDTEALAAYERASDISVGAPYPVLNALKLKHTLNVAISDRDRALLEIAKMRREMQARAIPPQDVPWCFFDLADIAVFSGKLEETIPLLARGALFAGRTQLRSHHRAIRPLAQRDPAWLPAVAFLDAEIARRDASGA